MVFPLQNHPQRYVIVTGLVLVTVALRWIAAPWIGSALAFSPFAVPLALSAFLFGPTAALLATAGGMAFGSMFAATGEVNSLTLIRGAIFLSVGLALWRAVAWMDTFCTRLVQAEHKAQQAHQYKDQFLAVLGHELRNPLNGIALGANVMIKQHGTGQAQLGVAQMIERQSKHMQKLLDDMLDISRIEQGKIQLAWHEVDLQHTLRICVEQQTAKLAKTGQTLRIHTPDHPVRVQGDPDRLIQIVANLLTNATKYSGPSSLIDLILSVAGTDAVLQVRDNGPGIPEDKLELIFQPFLQLDNAQAQGHGGLGLGLPTVKALVELHHGSVCASSAGLDGGATFTVRLPLQAAVSSAQ